MDVYYVRLFLVLSAEYHQQAHRRGTAFVSLRVRERVREREREPVPVRVDVGVGVRVV